ncbi:tetratricopeptide repeat protein [Actinomycetota bacterium]
MSSERQRLVDRQNLVERDIEELAEQIAEGEVDETTGGQLMAGYEKELASINAALTELPKNERKPAAKAMVTTPDKEAPSEGRSVRRIVVGSLVVIVALSGAIFFAARDTTPDDPGMSATAGPGDLTVDPDSVSNEQLEAVVAANPGIPAMRMALADRYFVTDQFPQALDHYLIVVDSNPTPEEETVVLARIGWIAHATGLPEAAEEYVMQSLAIDPNNSEAQLFLGFITFYGLDDPARAIPQFEAALQIDGLPAASVSQVEQALEEARARVDS